MFTTSDKWCECDMVMVAKELSSFRLRRFSNGKLSKRHSSQHSKIIVYIKLESEETKPKT
jgi:hypothetical protein